MLIGVLVSEIYYVEHLYEHQNLDEDKPLGFFSTLENAKKCIDFYKKLEGFNRYPKNFFIHKMKINKINWHEGFIKGFDIPVWALKYPPHQNETPLMYAKRVCDLKHGENCYTCERGSEFRELKAFAFYQRQNFKLPPLPDFDPIKKQMKKVYFLINVYETEIYFADCVKSIGVFSSSKNAKMALSYAKKLSGFKTETKNFFEISVNRVDDFDIKNWGFNTGFVDVKTLK